MTWTWLFSPTLVSNDPQCDLVGPFALVVQASMGALAVLSLVYKRNHENPRRPWLIWLFDVLKQVCGAAGLHMLNLLMSIVFSESGEPELDRNPCTWYFLNVLVDTTIGVPVLWCFLFLVHTTAFRCGVTGIVSGEYGHPPRWRAFFKQAALYLTAVVLMKIVLYTFFWWMPFVDDLGQFLISWTDFDPRVQVAFVVLLFPLVMNTLQYYLIDSIIQSSEYHNHSSPHTNHKQDRLLDPESSESSHTGYGAVLSSASSSASTSSTSSTYHNKTRSETRSSDRPGRDTSASTEVDIDGNSLRSRSCSPTLLSLESEDESSIAKQGK